MDAKSSRTAKAQFGIPGLDDILSGGLIRNRQYLFEGTPGSGKTTLALQFLLEGAGNGEKGLYITLSETEQELRDAAMSHGWSIPDSIEIFELVPPESLLDERQQQSLLYSSDLELGETTNRIFEAMTASKPVRVVLDSLSEIRLLAQSSLRYRRQILALKHYFSQSDVTVLLLDDLTADVLDKTVHSVAHGVVRLEELLPEYGAQRRRLRVLKYRGQSFRGGYHDFTIQTGGLQVFPRLVASESRSRTTSSILSTDIAGLDKLVGGGIESGSSTLVIGPAGTGKSLLVFQFIKAAVRRGEHVALFVFDEELGLLLSRTKAIGIELEAMRDGGKLFVFQVDAAEISPGEFAHRARKGGRERQHSNGRYRQSQWLSKRDAAGTASDPAYARVVAILEPFGCNDVSHRRSAWPGGRYEDPGRRHLSRRRGDIASLFRGFWTSAARHFRAEETQRRAREHDPRIHHQQQRNYRRSGP
jgi:circadian clock protein KaiC